jgi:hypothetical protein
MPVRRKKFILALQPHEAITHNGNRSPQKTLAFAISLLLLMGLAFSNALDDHLSAVKRGLTKIALGQQLCPYMPANDAIALLKDWYGITITCTEPTDAKWKAYCQQFYISEGGDCNGASPENKAMIMNNMRVCRVSQ